MQDNGGFRLHETSLNLGSDVSILKTSDGLGWPNVNVSLVGGRAYDREREIVHGGGSNLWVGMPLEPVDVSFSCGGKEFHSIMQPNRLLLVAPGALLGARRKNGARTLHVFLKSEIITEVANELFEHDAKDFCFETKLDFTDSHVAEMMHLLKHALFEPAEHSGLKIEYLSRGLAADVLSKHTVQDQDRANARIGERLTANQAHRVADFVREHLSLDVSLNELAAVAGTSRTIFIKRFKETFGQTPHQHVMKVRIQRAQQLLSTSSVPMSQISFECGFSDQAHFSARFRHATGLTPSAYRRQTR